MWYVSISCNRRYNKLPEDCGRHWAHVVDARAGPGVKNFVKVRDRSPVTGVTGVRSPDWNKKLA